MIIPRPRHLDISAGTVAFDPGAVRLAPDDPALGAEGYRLRVSASGIELAAGGPAGLFYGRQTLRQFGPAVPYGTIVDRPRFAWRGVLLDVARHFMPKAFVLRLIDPVQGGWTSVAWLVGTLAVAIVAAWALHVGVERPMEKRLRAWQSQRHAARLQARMQPDGAR